MKKALLTNDVKNVNFIILIVEYIKIINRRVRSMFNRMGFNLNNKFNRVKNDNMYSALELSYVIINKLYEKKDKSYLPTNMKLQKLLYFSQGYALRKLGEPIMNDEFQAWMNGPVIPDVWHNFKYFGTSNIVLNDDVIPAIISKEVEEILDIVIDLYGGKRPYELSDLTHEKGTAWSKVREQNKVPLGMPSKCVIPNEFIGEEFINKE